MNSISQGEGFSMMELMSCMGPWMAKIEELKAADRMIPLSEETIALMNDVVLQYHNERKANATPL